MLFVEIAILALLAATAVTVARIRDLWAAVMFTGIYSFLGASWMLILEAPDVAFTEAAVGAGISTVLMLSTLALMDNRKNHLTNPIEEKPARKWSILPFLVVAVTGAALVYGTLDMPTLGDGNAPVHQYPNPSFVEKSQEDMHGLPNVVTAVLASYRGYDTLGETAVIFTAGIAVLIILRRNSNNESDDEPGTKPDGDSDRASAAVSESREAKS